MSDEPNEEGAALTGGDAPQFNEVEDIAFSHGWRPEDQFQGPKDQWKPAADFLRGYRGNKELKKELREVKDQISRMASMAAKQTEKALEEEAARIQARFQDAVDNKDTEGAAKAARDMEKLRDEAKTTKPAAGASVEDDFASENPWYGTDEEATALAIGISQREAAKGKSVEDQLKAVQAGVRKRFPELFDKQEAPASRREPAAVAAPSRGGGKREKGYADLPAEVRRGIDNYAELFKQRHGKDIEESRKSLAKDYWADQDAA